MSGNAGIRSEAFLTLIKSTVSSMTMSYESSYYDVINLACVIYSLLERHIWSYLCFSVNIFDLKNTLLWAYRQWRDTHS